MEEPNQWEALVWQEVGLVDLIGSPSSKGCTGHILGFVQLPGFEISQEKGDTRYVLFPQQPPLKKMKQGRIIPFRPACNSIASHVTDVPESFDIQGNEWPRGDLSSVEDPCRRQACPAAMALCRDHGHSSRLLWMWLGCHLLLLESSGHWNPLCVSASIELSMLDSYGINDHPLCPMLWDPVEATVDRRGALRRPGSMSLGFNRGYESQDISGGTSDFLGLLGFSGTPMAWNRMVIHMLKRPGRIRL